MGGKEDLQQFGKGYFLRVEFDSNGFRMARSAATNLTIGRIFDMTSSLSRSHIVHAFNALENGFGTPKTSIGENGSYKIVHILFIHLW